jgi:hypothetical protein
MKKKNKEVFLKLFKIKCVFLSYIIQVKMKIRAMNVVKNKNKNSKLAIERK